jgi:prepilin-type processing-associated H-X9-DG protein
MNNRPLRTRLHAFTVVELVVVIAIIMVLIGLLMPGLVSVRRRSYALKCQSNLHQLGVALQAYADANKGKLLPYYIQGIPTWPSVVFSDTEPKILLCPTAQENESLSYELNIWVASQMFFANISRFQDRTSDQVVIAGENTPGSNSMYGGYVSSDGSLTWDPARHGSLGSNYLFLDFHVSRELPPKLPYLSSEWAVVWPGFTSK